jgi:predicted nucleic acid-binding protein
MAKVRKIDNSHAGGRHHYLVDANFLLNKHLPPRFAPTSHEQTRIKACIDWWERIDKHVRARRARVYCPDVCIAEAFKGLSRKHYREKWFPTYGDFAAARSSLSEHVRVPTKTLKAFDRVIPFHDISTNRDIIISVDRFFELFSKHGKNVQIADMILVATAKYLMDFYDIPKDHLHIVTLDNPLREAIAFAIDLPPAYDPTRLSHRAAVIFTT